MKVKLTPLNIVSSTSLVLAVWLLLKDTPTGSDRQVVQATGFLTGFCLLVAVVAFVSDLIFRKMIPSVRKIWIIEGVLIVFIIILIFIIRTSLS